MTVADLMELLEDMPEDAEIRIAHQPTWPLREILAAVVDGKDLSPNNPRTRPAKDAQADEDEEEDGDGTENVVWLVADGHPPHPESPYASKRLWERI